MQTIGEYEKHEEGGEQPHPDARREEASTVTSIGELFTSHIEGLDLEIMKSHLPEGGHVGHKETAFLAQTADVLTVERINARSCDLGNIEMGNRAIAVDFKSFHGKPISGRYWVEATSQNELECHCCTKEWLIGQ